MSWFPRPGSDADLELLAPSGSWTPAALRALLTHPSAEEWQHKVGVAGAADGSAKPTVRLLASCGWVFKTRVDLGLPSAAAARERALAASAAGRRAGVWHPEKLWALLRSGEEWLPLTVCRELTTLRQIERSDDRRLAWIDMLQASIDVFRLHGLGLDINPSNFGRDRDSGQIYYLDEELYERLTERGLANAIAARIPEEPELEPQAWLLWGRALREHLSIDPFTWDAIRDEVRQYPLSARFTESLGALVEALTPMRRTRWTRSAGDCVCVFADVHANLPALEAVLADARARGAERFLFLGDAIGYGPHPAECVRRLAELPNAIFIRGNHDHAIATGRFDTGMNRLARAGAEWTRAALSRDELAWLHDQPLELREEGWMAVHGAPRDPHRFLAYVYELTYEDNLRHLRRLRVPVCFYGHTHVQLTHADLPAGPTKLAGEQTFQLTPKHHFLVNPGSVGQPRDGDPRAGYALWNRRSGAFATVRVAYDLDRTVSALEAAGLPAQLGGRLRTGS